MSKCTDNDKVKKVYFFLSLFFISNNLIIGEETIESFSESTPKTKENEWYGIYPSKDYDFYCFEDFEERFRWKSQVRGAHEVIDRFIKMHPKDKIKYEKKRKHIQEIYQKDWEIFNESNAIHHRKKLNDPEHVYEIRSFFLKPGYDYLFISPSKGPVYIEGFPKMMSFYIHSRNYPHHLYAVFRKPDYSRIYVSLGNLKFNGWKRISKILPVTIQFYDQKRSKKPMAVFEGFKILSNKHTENRNIILMFDLIGFLIDKSSMRYPGYDIPDTWGN